MDPDNEIKNVGKPIRDRIIVPLDGKNALKVMGLIEKLKDVTEIACFKFNDAWDDADMGPSFFSMLHHVLPYLQVWIDVKLKDIPYTMGNRVRKIVQACKPRFITVMGDNNTEAIRAAVNAAEEESNGHTKILAVTVLTSINQEECIGIYNTCVNDVVERFALKTIEAGVYGIVCSPKEAELLRKKDELEDAKIVTPGVRPQWWLDKYPDKVDDQKRVTTAAQAINNGADYLVMGRPIYGEDDPVKAIEDTMAEINASLD